MRNLELERLRSITYENRSHSTRPIGRAQPSCVRPDWWWYLRRNGRSEVIGDAPRLVHAQPGNIHATNLDEQRAVRTIGVVQPSCITLRSWQNLRRIRRGGVVDRGDGFVAYGDLTHPSDNALHAVSYNQKKSLHDCMIA